MALAATFRSSVHSTTGATSYATGTAFTPGARSLLIAVVISLGDNADATSVSGNGTTYSLYNGVNRGVNARHSIWVADSGDAPTSDVVTASGWGTNRTGCHVMVIEITGADLTNGPLGALLQFISNSGTATSGALTLAAAADSNNRPFSSWEHATNEDTVPQTNWTELDDGGFAAPTNDGECQWRSDAFDTAAGATWTTSSVWSGCAVEIEIAPPPAAGEAIIQADLFSSGE